MKMEDLDAVLGIFWRAFEPPEADMILPMVYPQGLQPDMLASMRAWIISHQEEGTSSSGFCARNNATGEIAGISYWTLEADPPADAQCIEKAYEAAMEKRIKRPPVEGMNRELEAAFFKTAFHAELETMGGKSYVELGILATDSKYQGHGVGKALLAHGLEEVVDKLELPSFVLASRMGKPLYERAGFEEKTALPFDGRERGGRSEGRHWIMVRPAHGAGVRQ